MKISSEGALPSVVVCEVSVLVVSVPTVTSAPALTATLALGTDVAAIPLLDARETVEHQMPLVLDLDVALAVESMLGVALVLQSASESRSASVLVRFAPARSAGGFCAGLKPMNARINDAPLFAL